MASNDRILIIPDLHFPYCHPDSIDFISHIKKHYKPTRVICLGDETDGHSYSFHKASAELYSPAHELEKAIGYIETLGKIIPNLDLVDSNHGSLFYRRIADAGLPKKILKEYRDILDAPTGWKWHNHLDVKLPTGTYCKFIHGLGSNVLSASQTLGMSLVQGHFHNSFEIRYWSNGYKLYFGMTSGCLIDDRSLAFAYNKLSVKRPIIGLSAITDGYPELLPMPLDKHNRWKR